MGLVDLHFLVVLAANALLLELDLAMPFGLIHAFQFRLAHRVQPLEHFVGGGCILLAGLADTKVRQHLVKNLVWRALTPQHAHQGQTDCQAEHMFHGSGLLLWAASCGAMTGV